MQNNNYNPNNNNHFSAPSSIYPINDNQFSQYTGNYFLNYPDYTLHCSDNYGYSQFSTLNVNSTRDPIPPPQPSVPLPFPPSQSSFSGYPPPSFQSYPPNYIPPLISPENTNISSELYPNNSPNSYPSLPNQQNKVNYNVETSQPIPSSNYGRKRALFIGINYFGMAVQLKGPINDIHNMKNFLIKRFNWKETPETMLILTDDQNDPSKIPTRANMIAGMKWLVNGASNGDVLFFHYSGHGGQVEDKDGDEESGYDETILPVDYAKAGVIIDDELNEILVQTLPIGVKLIAIFDSCHSGTAMDLPYVYNVKGKIQHGDKLLSHIDNPVELVTLGLEKLLSGQFSKKHRKAVKKAREKNPSD